MSIISCFRPLCTFPQDFIISLLDFIDLYKKNIKIEYEVKNAPGKVMP